MSNGSFFPEPRRRGGTLAIVLVALIPTCFVGWLLWSSLGGSKDDGADGAGGASGPTTSSTSSPPPPSSGTSAPSAPAPSGEPGRPGAPGKPLKGKVVVLDPGHNPHNRDHPSRIARLVDIGTETKECDTTGTATNSGYPEASFTLDVARRARTLLEARGATVRFTQDGDRPYGPCVDERAEIGNKAHADAAVSVHADGAAAGERGFHVILPKSVRGGGADTSAITAPSRQLGERLRGEFAQATGSAPAGYIGDGSGLDVRGDLGGLNLSTVPKVFIECGNMRDSQDAAELTDKAWRERAAHGIAQGITDFLNE
ncbi:N-acetylmuramoyl-L-alanine amidase [Streptomyces rapamycinicus]|uniref:Cell wall hydrolase/autolysin n=2 Tax=Streptomyces rapamycinicus TaxID=1226757 RepID=A0A3L8RI42_STRRN|nr:N-acetylmuramoyl-L-alanine amidase [Streptomyces rapamycinicus]MBB4785917.1 N-acetylmuramoyl-L-alanine amidase [Streptomyces rapamycinicus]RLV78622.1 cell wall hydrolase/autolysin [Streptomyces rapamycinicus NRRL 5491]UTO66056.1 N-acetylmuramoyl-L-alanine amidase [Streptomyces rapamycinicus]UTP34010.1 N-acetylmuramoyl-L-alanine amidase [Streptomyces rapamycinicus NRRL 5491]